MRASASIVVCYDHGRLLGSPRLVVPGYELTTCLRESPRALVFRATRKADRVSVVIKAPGTPFPSPQDIAQIRAEHEIYRRFNNPRVAAALGLEPCSHGLALVLEDAGGENLRALLRPEFTESLREPSECASSGPPAPLWCGWETGAWQATTV